MSQELDFIISKAKKIEEARGADAQMAYLVRALATVLKEVQADVRAARADALYSALCMEHRDFAEAVSRGRRSFGDMSPRECAGLWLRTSRSEALAKYDADEQSRLRYPGARDLIEAAQVVSDNTGGGK
jgi:hypothetical protein